MTDDATSTTAADDHRERGWRHQWEEAQELIPLQIELVKLQRHLIAAGGKLLVILEGRDAAGKDGTIKRVVEHLSPRETRVVALPVPTERDRSTWYFQRWVAQLPAGSEFVIFNRSWYNRAGVERVMGFCSPDQFQEFMDSVPAFEQMLVRSNIHLFKYYLDVSKSEQAHRLEDRKRDPLKQWKSSPLDAVAQERWDDYSRARDQMLQHTHTKTAPWTIVRADHKHHARVNIMRDLLSRLDYEEKDQSLLATDDDVLFEFPGGAPRPGLLTP